jgi:hypothetical protein
MSGSGNGNYIPPQRSYFDCETGVIRISVSSIDVNVLSKHKVGDILKILLGTKDELLIEDGDGETLGAVLHLNTTDILNCIKNGYQFEAEILSINSPSCRAEIRRNRP